MSYENKYNDFKAEAIIKLRQLLNEKGYDREEKYNNSDEDFPTQYVFDSSIDEIYSIVLWDGESFKGIGHLSKDDYWFEIEELDLFTLCQIADYINEHDKVQ